jgi:hypothetical protein
MANRLKLATAATLVALQACSLARQPLVEQWRVDSSHSVSAVPDAFKVAEIGGDGASRHVVKFDHMEYHGIPMKVDYKPIMDFRLNIRLYGEDWIITDLDRSKSLIALAKESAPAKILYAGQTVSAGDYTVKLADFTVPHGMWGSQAIVRIYDRRNKLVREDTVAASTSKQISLPDGDGITLRVYRLSPGLAAAKWAEMALLTEQITLQTGKKYGNNRVKLIWDGDVLKEIRLKRLRSR